MIISTRGNTMRVVTGLILACSIAACIEQDPSEEEVPLSEPANTSTASDDTPGLDILATPTCNTSGVYQPPGGVVAVRLPFFRDRTRSTIDCNMVQGTES